jgi:hypothetical protein
MYVCSYVLCVCVHVCVLAVYFYCHMLYRVRFNNLIIIIRNGFERERSLYYLSCNVDICVGELRRTTTKSNLRYLLPRPVLELRAS